MSRAGHLLVAVLVSLTGSAAGAYPNGAPAPGTKRRPDAAASQVVSGIGSVNSVDASAKTFVVRPQSGHPISVSVITTTQTQWVKGDGTPAAFSDLVSGTPVGIRGQTAGSGGLTALKVFIFASAAAGSTATAGAVTRMDAGSRTFVVKSASGTGSSTTWTLTPSTRLQKSDGSAATVSDLAVSVELGLQGSASESGATAQHVIVFTSSGEPVSGSGTITRVDRGAGTFLLQPQGSRTPVTVTTTPATQYAFPNGSPGGFSLLSPGLQVSIQGKSGANGVTAERIMVAISAQNRGAGAGLRGRRGVGPR
jgi:hypothetical protein